MIEDTLSDLEAEEYEIESKVSEGCVNLINAKLVIYKGEGSDDVNKKIENEKMKNKTQI